MTRLAITRTATPISAVDRIRDLAERRAQSRSAVPPPLQRPAPWPLSFLDEHLEKLDDLDEQVRENEFLQTQIREGLKEDADAAATINLQDGVRTLLLRGADVRDFFGTRLERLAGRVLIGDEIGSGVVPVDPFERRWRDETGLLYQFLARESAIVDRVWAGLAVRLKG